MWQNSKNWLRNRRQPNSKTDCSEWSKKQGPNKRYDFFHILSSTCWVFGTTYFTVPAAILCLKHLWVLREAGQYVTTKSASENFWNLSLDFKYVSNELKVNNALKILKKSCQKRHFSSSGFAELYMLTAPKNNSVYSGSYFETMIRTIFTLYNMTLVVPCLDNIVYGFADLCTRKFENWCDKTYL